MKVNQRGMPIEEEQLFPAGPQFISDEDVRNALDVLCEFLKVTIVKTNATKSGYPELEVRADTQVPTPVVAEDWK